MLALAVAAPFVLLVCVAVASDMRRKVREFQQRLHFRSECEQRRTEGFGGMN